VKVKETMTPQDCFGVFVRAIGLILLLTGIGFFASTWVSLLHPFPPSETMRAWFLYLGLGLPVSSLYFLRGAPALVKFCYPTPNVDAEN
jgi:hypothetical protein